MRTALLVALAVMAPVAGCLGDVQGASISEQKLQEEGWSQSDSSEKSVAMGAAQLVTTDYRPNGGGDTTGVTVATTNDVPILDEKRFIPQAIERVEEQRGIDFQEDGSTKVDLPELGVDQADAQLYKFNKDGAQGKAILITPDQCDGFVITVGFGVTQGVTGAATYEPAKDVARHVVC
jgi:hypothetical protein